jgi:hypothetical protein
MMEMPYIPEGLRILAAEGELDAFLSGVREYGELCARMAREQERERCALICEERAGTVSMFANSKEAGAHNHAVRGCAAAIRKG